MKRPNPSKIRRGFALILVTANLMLLISFWNMANRQTGHLLRLETSLSIRTNRDQGSLTAVATGVGLLETGIPTTSPFVGSIELATIKGTVKYLVTFTDQGANQWKVEAAVAPLDDMTDPLPSTFDLTP